MNVELQARHIIHISRNTFSSLECGRLLEIRLSSFAACQSFMYLLLSIRIKANLVLPSSGKAPSLSLDHSNNIGTPSLGSDSRLFTITHFQVLTPDGGSALLLSFSFQHLYG